MKIVPEILNRVDLTEPDGRPLYAYEVTTEEQQNLGEFLRTQIRMKRPIESTASDFVLWASEHIRTQFAGGQLKWEFVFDALEFHYEWDAAARLTELGLQFWQRPLRRSNAGHREFLFSLLAEGGLPDMALAQAVRYRKVLLDLIHEIEAEGSLGHALAEAAALRAVAELPQVMRTGEQARLLAELASMIVAARSWIPESLQPEETESWLDTNRPGWRQKLPLRFSAHALEALIRPALLAERIRVKTSGALVERQLRRTSQESEWVGVAIIADGARLLNSMLPSHDTQTRMRLLADDGAVFLATPAKGGWDLLRSNRRGAVELARAPDQAVLLSVHIDGKSAGEVVIDSGQPPPEIEPSLWRPEDSSALDPVVLVPLSGRGQTRATKVFALALEGSVPESVSGISIGEPEVAPGGVLWPLSGQGEVRIGERVLRLSTEAEADAPAARLMACGKGLIGFVGRADIPIFLGSPMVLGAEGDQPFERQGKNVIWREIKHLLGGMIVEWCENDVVLARLRLVVLPESLQLNLRESSAGRFQLKADGVPEGWHLRLFADDNIAQDRSAGSELMQLELDSAEPLDIVGLRLKDPTSGASVELAGFLSVREAAIFKPSGKHLKINHRISVKRLLGWRGSLPEVGGALQLGLAGRGASVAFSAGGPIRLAAYSDLVEQALALMNADGQVNLGLVGRGRETPRLEIGRSDWESEEAGPFRHLTHGVTKLNAVCLDDPTRTASTEVKGRIDLAYWLSDTEGLWFVQGRHETCGVMRPFVWSASQLPPSSRDKRVAEFAKEWQRLIETPDDPDWAASWQMIAAVRSAGDDSVAGDASALDKILALAEVPAAAAALVLRVPWKSRAAALALEAETPIWWPLVRCVDWERAMIVLREHLLRTLQAAGLSDVDVRDHIARSAGDIASHRPELAAHLAYAVAAVEVDRDVISRTDTDALRPVPANAAKEVLNMEAQNAGRRFERLPQGVGGLQPVKISIDFGLSDEFKPLLHAPMVVAEVATDLRPQPDAHQILQLIALRAADPLWFDAALPAAIALAMETN